MELPPCHNTLHCCVSLPHVNIYLFTVKVVELSGTRSKQCEKMVSVLWMYFITHTENSYFHIVSLTTFTPIIPLSLRPKGYTGTGDCKSYRWHCMRKSYHTVWEKKNSSPSISLTTGSYFLHTAFQSLSQPLGHVFAQHYARTTEPRSCNSIWFPSMHNPLLLPRRHSRAPS